MTIFKQKQKLNVVVIGAGGRMGTMLTQTLIHDPHFTLVGAVVRQVSTPAPGDPGVSLDVQALANLFCNDLESVIHGSDVLIDFSTRETTLNALSIADKHKKAMVIGTTGFTLAEEKIIQEYSKRIPIVFEPNMSVGVNLVWKLLEQVAWVLGHDTDIEIIETHHREKIDAPSGTALKMGHIIADSLNWDFDDVACFNRHGTTEKRTHKQIGFQAIRAGDVIGDHTALFAGEGERIEITHKASSRMSYVKGALKAALWLNLQKAGLYDMHNVLGLKH